MEKIKAKVEQVLHKGDHTTDKTTGTHAGTHTSAHTAGTHGVTGNSGTHTGYTGEERIGNPTHIGNTGHTGGLTGSTANTHGGGLTGNTHTGHGNAHTSDPTGPHDSKLANKLDPRVDSTQVGGYGNSASIGGQSTGHSGGGLTGTNTHTGTHTGHNTYASDPTGPHDSRLGNKVDPRVDSDHVGGYGNTHTGHTGGGLTGNPYTGHTGGGLTGNTHAGHANGGLTGNNYSSDPTGPHDSHFSNKVDPRVDSEHAGGYGNTTGTGGYGNSVGGGITGNSTHSGAHGTHGTTGGLTGSHLPGPAANTAGPHRNDLLNKVDPRVDADLDGSKTYGGNKTYGN